MKHRNYKYTVHYLDLDEEQPNPRYSEDFCLEDHETYTFSLTARNHAQAEQRAKQRLGFWAIGKFPIILATVPELDDCGLPLRWCSYGPFTGRSIVSQALRYRHKSKKLKGRPNYPKRHRLTNRQFTLTWTYKVSNNLHSVMTEWLESLSRTIADIDEMPPNPS